ncbi:NAD(P)-dependent oxidoreductase [Taibaiella lutea]|uniref:NAD(P)-dependent oxidoreductase n=1 Tax=Taibaiella lutea TaxID=2608001 RepID=A0A5M6CK98_9BACT|nr:NAD(P)-dependent oxidoreductase [Taibaiella lutea]KAA5533765.1 NAD(P)-dependent oxidoreductase [Taibaiella lutea]
MKKILITGAGGLVGTHLIQLLQQDNIIYTISQSIISENNINIDLSKEWDIALLPNDIDAIIHLAQSRKFRQFPETATDIFYTNTLSTLKLIDFAHKTGVKKFIYASSGGIYGTGDVAFIESDAITYPQNQGFYLTSKYSSELILDNYANLLDIVQLRFFFVYGNGQDQSMLIPRLVDSVKTGKPIILQGKEGIKINPIHVSDAVKAIKDAIDIKGSHKINIAGPESMTIKRIGELIGRLTQREPNFIYEDDKPVKSILGDIQKMKDVLHAPTVTVEEGIKSII